MPFAFSYVCDLLQEIDDRSGQSLPTDHIRSWFDQHRNRLSRDDVDGCALLSTLLPEHRTDRVYNLQSKALQRKVARSLGLGRSRINELERWERPGFGVDLADCVEDILRATPNPPQPSVSVEEIDAVLQGIASRCRFSSPAVRARRTPPGGAQNEDALGDLYRRLSARDAKWLTRLVLKDYRPVVLDPASVFQSFHPLLPSILRIQDDFAAAMSFLREQTNSRGVTQGPLRKDELIRHLRPKLGVKVGRQPWFKARSIKHCASMAHGRMSCERKIDGEYAQIHVDLSKGARDCIQIFSKSGKDSTQDRKKLHDAIRSSLQIGEPSCKLKTGCILEGEMVVYNERDGKIQEFDKIRKHVSRSGVFLGTGQDSQPHEWEHLMIVYFDVLMVDGESLLGLRQSERFKRLEQIINCRKGRAELVERQIIDFNARMAASDLRRAFAKCITSRQEGLVLKPDDPYFDFSSSRRRWSCCSIKLKKEYINNFGDVGDFAVVGARYEAAKAKEYGIPGLRWTHFYIGCLENREQVRRWDSKPQYVVTNTVELNKTQMDTFLSCGPHAVPAAQNDSFDLRIEPGVDNGKAITEIFSRPLVVDVRCFSFHKEGNTGFWSLRFPMVTKIHSDRTFMDAITFAELQEMAEEEKAAQNRPPEDSQEMNRWIADLEQADPGGVPMDAMSQTTVSTAITPASPATTTSFSQVSRRLAVSSSFVSNQNYSLSQPPLRRPSLRVSTDAQQRTPFISSVSQDEIRTDSTATTPHPLDDGQKTPVERQKRRPLESPIKSPRPAKQARRSTDYHHRRLPSSSSQSSTQSMPTQTTQTTHREPLGEISANSQQRDNHSSQQSANPRVPGVVSFYMPSTSHHSYAEVSFRHRDAAGATHKNRAATPIMSSSQTGPFYTAPTSAIPSSQPAPTKPDSPPLLVRACTSFQPQPQQATQSPPPSPEAETEPPKAPAGTPSCPPGICHVSGTGCCFARCTFVLAPCIAATPYVTEDLLRLHGVVGARVVTDPEAWKQQQPSDCSASFGDSSSTSIIPPSSAETSSISRERRGRGEGKEGRGRRIRKIALVESRRKEATEAFLTRIGDAGLTTGSGARREWVEVYDWRLLEAVTKHEAKRRQDPGQSEGRGGDRTEEGADNDAESEGTHDSVARRAAADKTRVREIFRGHWIGLA